MLKLITALLLFCACHALTPISFSECERSKACFKTSHSCTVDTCEFGITWKTVFEKSIEYVEFEMMSKLYSDNGYIVLGVSEDRSLGNDGFVGCYANGASNANVIAGFTTKSGNMRVIQDDQELLVTASEDPANEYLGAVFDSIGARLSCRFRRRMTPQRSSQQLKDLQSGRKYYLMGARGTQASSYSLEAPSPGSLIFSDVPVDFTRGSFNAVSGSSPADSGLAKTHGVLMVIAWIFCSSVGIIMSRYYKQIWPNTGLANEAVWFQVHRSLQGTAVLLTTVAFILIFIHVGGYSQLDKLPFRAHPILGIIVFILAFLNPLVALCRCKPANKDRPWFNWVHFFIGSIAYCLSVPTIMIGMRLPAAGLQLSRLDYPQWILIFFVLFQFAVEIILEIHGCLYYRRNKDKQHTYEMEMEEYQAALIANHAPHTQPLPPKQSGRKFKYFMLGLHVVVAAIVTLLLVIIIIVN